MRVKLIGGAEVVEAGGTLATLLVDGGKCCRGACMSATSSQRYAVQDSSTHHFRVLGGFGPDPCTVMLRWTADGTVLLQSPQRAGSCRSVDVSTCCSLRS